MIKYTLTILMPRFNLLLKILAQLKSSAYRETTVTLLWHKKEPTNSTYKHMSFTVYGIEYGIQPGLHQLKVSILTTALLLKLLLNTVFNSIKSLVEVTLEVFFTIVNKSLLW